MASDGSILSTEAGRRLQSSTTTYMTLQSDRHVVHELGTSCSNVNGGTHIQLLPTKADNSVSWDSSPTDATADLSLVAVNLDWTTLLIQRFPAPFKVVHGASCSSAPSLNLQLETTVQTLVVSGTLTVSGTAVLPSLWTEPMTWTNLYIPSGSEQHGGMPQCAVSKGVVYLRGGVRGANGNFGHGNAIVQGLPTEATPSRYLVVLMAIHNQNHVARIHIEPAGQLSFQGGDHAREVIFDGISYALP